MLSEKPKLLMCEPIFFEPALPDPVHGPANEFEIQGRKDFLDDPAGFRQRAHEQWSNLRDIFVRYADIVYISPQPGYHDQVYTADGSFSLITYNGSEQRFTALSRFTNEKRNPEVYAHQIALKTLGDKRSVLKCDYAFEGNGDSVFDPARNIIWSGYTEPAILSNAINGRTDLKAHGFLRFHTKTQVVGLQTTAPFYHIDTVLAPLSKGHIVAHYKSLYSRSQNTFLQKAFHERGYDPAKYLIEVSKADAHAFATNLRCFGDTVIMPKCSQKLQDKIKSKGYEVITADVSAFIAGGGAIHCLSNVVNEVCDLNPHPN